MKKTWSALQLVQSNGAYGGRTIRFMTPEGLVTGELRRAGASEEKPGNTLLRLVGNDWYAIPNETLVEVL